MTYVLYSMKEIPFIERICPTFSNSPEALYAIGTMFLMSGKIYGEEIYSYAWHKVQGQV
jgi:hypothetical protein